MSESENDQTTPLTEYLVEAIVDSREVNGRTEYLLKWQGYSDSENTWEPEEHCNCVALIKKFKLKSKQPIRKSDRISAAIEAKDEKKRQSVSARVSRSSTGSSTMTRGGQSANEEDTSSGSTTRIRKSGRISAAFEAKEDKKKRQSFSARVSRSSTGSSTKTRGHDKNGNEEDTSSGSTTRIRKSGRISAAFEAKEDKKKRQSISARVSRSSTGSSTKTRGHGKSDNEEDTSSGSTTRAPDSYMISAGEEVEEVIGVSQVLTHGLMALVQYKNGEREAVPTRLLMDLCAKPLAVFYEARMKIKR